MDVGGVEEPNVAIIVFQELRFHLEDLLVVDFLNVVSDLVALLLSIHLIIFCGSTLQQVDIFRHVARMHAIFDLLGGDDFIEGSEELHINGYTDCFGLDARLNAGKCLPLEVIGPTLEFI